MVKEKVFTFWEGEMPEYIKLCLETWKFDYVLLNYSNLNDYTNIDIPKIKKYTLAQISDVVRTHVVRDHGGYWLDTDTIMLTEKLPEENMIGIPEHRGIHCGFLHFEVNAPMLVEWSDKQDEIINSNKTGDWDLFANGCSDPCVKEHIEVSIKSRDEHFPELYKFQENTSDNRSKYIKFYFQTNLKPSDIRKTDLLMLHNSWTPAWYKRLSREEVLKYKCTMSNILKELI